MLGISGVLFTCFLIFVFVVLRQFVEDDDVPSFGLDQGSRVGVVEVRGVIMDSKRTLKQLRKFVKDKRIKGIVIRVDSPGGAVGPSQEIYDAVIRAREKKPVVASFGSVAASGGYYIAAATEKIVSNPGTITGSIGVIMQFTNLQKLYGWAKIARFNIKSGKFKDTGSDSREMTAEERQIMQDLVDNAHSQFVRAVAKGRNLSVEAVKMLATGQIYTGEQAKGLKLVDEMGGLKEAGELIAELADFEGEPVLVYPKKRRKRFLENFGSSIGISAAQTLLRAFNIPVPPEMSEIPIPTGLMFLAPGLQ